MKIDIHVTDNSLRCVDHRWFNDHNFYDFFVYIFIYFSCINLFIYPHTGNQTDRQRQKNISENICYKATVPSKLVDTKIRSDCWIISSITFCEKLK